MKYLPVLILLLVISACTPYGHWGRYDYWEYHCPDFPAYEEVKKVLIEHKELLDKMHERNLIYKTPEITACPTVKGRTHSCLSGKCDGAFITLYSKNKASAIKMLDEANARTRGYLLGPAKKDDEGLTMFYGVPFRFIRD